MHVATISQLKKELKAMPPQEVLETCMRLMKYKKENKELVSYLVFDKMDEKAYVKSLKLEVTEMFKEVNTRSLHWAKKTLRKIIRFINKSCKYSGIATTHIELLLHFCNEMNALPFIFSDSKVVNNMYESQLKKINQLVTTLHEDLQFDYQDQIASL